MEEKGKSFTFYLSLLATSSPAPLLLQPDAQQQQSAAPRNNASIASSLGASASRGAPHGWNDSGRGRRGSGASIDSFISTASTASSAGRGSNRASSLVHRTVASKASAFPSSSASSSAYRENGQQRLPASRSSSTTRSHTRSALAAAGIPVPSASSSSSHGYDDRIGQGIAHNSIRYRGQSFDDDAGSVDHAASSTARDEDNDQRAAAAAETVPLSSSVAAAASYAAVTKLSTSLSNSLSEFGFDPISPIARAGNVRTALNDHPSMASTGAAPLGGGAVFSDVISQSCRGRTGL